MLRTHSTDRSQLVQRRRKDKAWATVSWLLEVLESFFCVLDVVSGKEVICVVDFVEALTSMLVPVVPAYESP